MKDIIKYATTICLIHTFLFTAHVYGQKKSFPEIGKVMPAFAIKTDQKRKGDVVSSEKLKGQYYILDFWNTGCASCVASFPKMDSLQKKYGSNLQIILVGLEEKYRDVQKFYNVYRQKFDLKISSTFDSATFKQLVHSGVPHLIWVNQKGIVQAITTTTDVNEENIRLFLAGRNFKFQDASYSTKNYSIYDRQKPLLINGNGGSDTSYAFRSILALWKPGMGNASFPAPYPRRVNEKVRYQITAAPIDVLYDMAYFGTLNIQKTFPNTYPIPKFSENAIRNIQNRFETYQRFSYSLEMPYEIATTEILMKKMQNDLEFYFGAKGNLVRKVMPCYILTISNKDKVANLISTSEKQSSTWKAEETTHRFLNISVQQLIEILPSKLIPLQYIYILDETGLTSKISFDIKAKIYDLESIQKGLKDIGLDLIPTTREMQVLEIDVLETENDQVN